MKKIWIIGIVGGVIWLLLKSNKTQASTFPIPPEIQDLLNKQITNPSTIPIIGNTVDTSVKWDLMFPSSDLPSPPPGYGYWKGPFGYNLAPLETQLPNYLYSWI